MGGRHDAGLPHGGRLKDGHAPAAVGSGSGHRLHARLAVNLQFAVPGLHVGDQGLLLLQPVEVCIYVQLKDWVKLWGSNVFHTLLTKTDNICIQLSYIFEYISQCKVLKGP